MIAPVGSLKKNHDLGGQILDHYGVFPRAVLQLFEQIKSKGGLMTLSICQMGGWQMFPIDLVSDKTILFDDKMLQYMGLSEVVLNSQTDIVNLMLMLEKKRFT